MAEFLEHLLRQHGHHVVRAADGEEAWTRMAPNPAAFDVVMTDHQMPRLSGLQLVKRLRAIGYQGIIIVHSGGLTMEEESAYRKLGVHGVLPKSADFTALAAAIRRLAAGEQRHG